MQFTLSILVYYWTPTEILILYVCVYTCVHNLLIVCPLILNYVHTVSRARVRTHYTTLFAHIESFGLARVYRVN